MRRLILSLLLLIVPSITAQEATPESTPEPEIALTPFTLEEPRINGVRPIGWNELIPGTYVREDGQNLTYLLHMSEPDASRSETLPPLLESIGQEALPTTYEVFEGTVLEWEVYDVIYTPKTLESDLAVVLAIAESDSALHVIFLQSSPEDADDLRETVFFPALDAYGLPLPVIYESLGLAPLEAVTIPEFDVQSAVPAEWQMVNIGSYMRLRTQSDSTTLIIQTSPDLSAEVFGALLLESLGIGTELPEESTRIETDHLTWTLYEVAVSAQGQALRFQIALAEDDIYAYMVVLLSADDEATQLRETALIPILRTTFRANTAPES